MRNFLCQLQSGERKTLFIKLFPLTTSENKKHRAIKHDINNPVSEEISNIVHFFFNVMDRNRILLHKVIIKGMR